MPSTITSASNRPYTKVERQRQPNGEDGVRFSLKKVCLMIAEGRIHPDVRAWTMKQLAAVGNPKGPRARAEALLNAVRKQSGWIPDPTDSEFMAGAHLTLGDGTKPPFFALGDCFAEGTPMIGEGHQVVRVESIVEGMRIWGLDRWSTVERVAYKGILPLDIIFFEAPRVGPYAERVRANVTPRDRLLLTGDHHVYVLDCLEHAMLTPEVEEAKARPDDRYVRKCDCPHAARSEKRVRVTEVRAGMMLSAPTAITSLEGGRRSANLSMRRVVSIAREAMHLPCWDITTDDHRVYLPESDVTVSQCDDLTIALGSSILASMMFLSAAESVGAKAAVVGHAYGKNRMIEHVLGAIWDPPTNQWYYVDPSLTDMPFGKCKEFTRERVYLVPSAELFCDDRVCLLPGGKAAGPPPVPRRGDFVAVNGTSDIDAPASTEPMGWGSLGDVPAPTLIQEYDITGINEIAVTHKPPPSAQRIINQGMAQMWMDAAPCTDPMRWFAINPPIEGDAAAQDLLEPWSNGQGSDAASWSIPNSGFMCTPSSR